MESDSTFMEDVLRDLGRIKAAHMRDCDDVSCESYDEEYIGRYSRLLEGIQILLDIIRSQSALTPWPSRPSTVRFDFSEAVFDGLPFKDRLSYLENSINQLEDLIGVHVAEIKSVLSKDVLVVLDGSILDILRRRDIVPAWIGSSEFLYVICGAIEPKSLVRLRLLLADITGNDHMIAVEQLPGKYGGRLLVTAITLKEYEPELGKFVGFVPCKKVAFRDISISHLQMIERLISQELDLAVQAKHSIGTLDSLLTRGRTYSFRAWVPKKRLNEFRATVDEASAGTAKLVVSEPQRGDEVPTLLDNPFLIKPFESVLEMFSLPSYDELDPTFFMAFAILVLFGLMFGDVGHGLLVVFCGLSVSLVSKDVRYRNIGIVALLCGIAAVFAGLLYGTVFGLRDVIAPLWRRPVIDMGFMIVVIAVGIAHMSLGLVIGLVNRLLVEEGIWPKLASFLSNLSQLLLFSSVLLLLSYDYLGVSSMIAISVFLIAFPLSILMIFLMHPLLSVLRGEKLMLSDDLVVGVSDVLHVMMSIVSNTISYTRVLILALIHEISSEIVLRIGGLAGGLPLVGTVASSVILVVGTVVILLEGVITFIQAVRLNYYEFFNKFYKGGGLKYEPFSL